MLQSVNSDAWAIYIYNGLLIRGMTVRAMTKELLMFTHDDDDSACVLMSCQCLLVVGECYFCDKARLANNLTARH